MALSLRDAVSARQRYVPPARLAATAYDLYEKFRPAIPEGTRGWGAKGTLDLKLIRALARKQKG